MIGYTSENPVFAMVSSSDIINIYPLTPFIIRTKMSFLKMFRLVFGILITASAIYLLITKVGALREILGTRIESAIAAIFYDQQIDGSINTRVAMRTLAMEYFSQRKIFGYGINFFGRVSPWHVYSHNNFTEILSGCGIVGFCIYYSRYLWLLIKTISMAHRENKAGKASLFCVFAFTVIMMITDWWQVSYYFSFIQVVYPFIVAVVTKGYYNLPACAAEANNKNYIGVSKYALY